MKKYLKIILSILVVVLISTQSIAKTKNLSINDDTKFENIREQAKILYLGKQYEQSLNHISTIPDTNKNEFDYYLMGLTSKEPKLAIKAYEKAIEINKEFYQAYFNLGEAYYKLQNYDKAIENYKLSIKHKKDFAYAHYNLGCTYLAIEDFKNARKSFEGAIKINPKEPDYYYNLGYTYKKLNNTKRADKALSLYNQLIDERLSN